MASIWLVSGERGSGKTSLCAAVVRRIRAAGWDVAGLLSPAVTADGRKIGIDVLALRSGARRRLANARLLAQESENDIQTRAWSFDGEALEWGNQVLQTAAPCDLLVIDELGMLEFERGQGWLNGMETVDRGLYRHALVVIRPELLAAAQARWAGARIIQISQVDEQQAQALADQILSDSPG